MAWLAALLVRILVFMFFAGAIGSAVVFVLSAISEIKGALSREHDGEIDRMQPSA